MTADAFRALCARVWARQAPSSRWLEEEGHVSQTIITRHALDAQMRESGAAAYGLTPSCHPTAGVDIVYAGGGRLLVWCHRCHGDVAILAVAGGLPAADHA